METSKKGRRGQLRSGQRKRREVRPSRRIRVAGIREKSKDMGSEEIVDRRKATVQGGIRQQLD